MRGEIYWVDLGDPVGSEPSFRRPALVIQNDAANRAGSTTIVAMVSSKIPEKEYPMHVLLPQDMLPRPSVVKCEQLVTVDVEHRILDEYRGPVAVLDAPTMCEVDRALGKILDL